MNIYITITGLLQKNNAIARLALQFDLVTRVFPLGNRSWTDYHMDPSDRDHSECYSHFYRIPKWTGSHKEYGLLPGGNQSATEELATQTIKYTILLLLAVAFM